MNKKMIKEEIEETKRILENFESIPDLKEVKHTKRYMDIVNKYKEHIDECEKDYEQEVHRISLTKFFNYFYTLVFLFMFSQLIFEYPGMTFCILIYMVIIIFNFYTRYSKKLKISTIKDNFYYKIFWFFSTFCIIDFLVVMSSFFNSISIMSSSEICLNILYIYILKPIISAFLTISYIDLFLDISGKKEMDLKVYKKI